MSNRLTKTTESRALEMLSNRVPQRRIAEQLDISKSAVARLALAVKPPARRKGKTPRPRPVPQPPPGPPARTAGQALAAGLPEADRSILFAWLEEELEGAREDFNDELRANLDRAWAKAQALPKCPACGHGHYPTS